VTRLAPITALGLAAAATLFMPGVASAQQPPPPPVTVLPPAATPPPVAGSATAIAGATPVFADKTDFKAPRKPTGWDPRLSLGGTVSFANNSNVAGQISGTSFAIGLKADVAADYNNGDHEWRNTLAIQAGVTRTPVIDEFVKTSDVLNLETTYLYHVVDWFGPFVRGQMLTSMFPGRDVRSGAVSYLVTEPDGTQRSLMGKGTDCTPNATGAVATTCRTSLSLSDGFRPLTFKESIGLFVQPYQSEPATFELRGAFGAQEVIANNQLSVSGTQDPTTPNVIALTRLSNAQQAGPDLALSVWGTVLDKRVIYKINADVMTPALHSALPMGDTRSAVSLTNIQMDATVSFKLVEWASLDYQFRALRQPQVIDTVQVQNAVLLTFGLSYPGKTPPPPPPACLPAAQEHMIPPPPAAPAEPPPAAK
jgi:hypothetical protein